VLVIDRSGSMAGQQLKAAKAAAKELLGQLNLNRDRVGLVTFASDASLNQPLSHDGASIEAAIDQIQVGGGTNIAKGVAMAHDELSGSHHNLAAMPVMIFLSDGR